MNPSGGQEVNQPVEISISGGQSVCFPNKGISFKATNKTPISGPKNMTTSIFGLLQKEYKVKFRVGGNGQLYCFGVNEVVQRILDYPKLRVGGVKNTVATWYLNGSYWSLGFPQRKPDERYVENEYNVEKDSVSIFTPLILGVFIDTLIQFDTLIDDTLKHMVHVILSAETATLLSLPRDLYMESSDLHRTVFAKDPSNNKIRVLAELEEGSLIHLQNIAQRLLDLTIDTNRNYFESLDTLIDIDNWLHYLSFIHFFGISDVVTNNVDIGITHKDKLFVLPRDFDDVARRSNNFWIGADVYDPRGYDGFMHLIIRIILRNEKAKERFLIIYQDMLNTVFIKSRMLNIVDEIQSMIRPEKQYMHESWNKFRNGGMDSLSQEYLMDFVHQWLEDRETPALQENIDHWIKRDSLHAVSDRNNLSLIFDSIPDETVKILLNKHSIMQFSENWNGKYLKNALIEIDVETSNIPSGYEIIIKEYPDSGLHFNILINENKTITPILSKMLSTNIKKEENTPLMVFPNPTENTFVISDFGLLTITDILGRETMMLEINNSIINVSNLPSGLYFIHLNNGREIKTGQLIKR
jgi:hypothetical protein